MKLRKLNHVFEYIILSIGNVHSYPNFDIFQWVLLGGGTNDKVYAFVIESFECLNDGINLQNMVDI